MYSNWFNTSTIEWFKERARFAGRSLVSFKVQPKGTTETYTYGILVKNHDDFLFIKSAAEDMRNTVWYFIIGSNKMTIKMDSL